MQGLVKADELEKLSDEQVLARASGWLSDTGNTRWLLVFDNYDEPEEFVLDVYCPHAGYGAIIITTRLPELVRGQEVRVPPLQDIEDSLDILQTRSRRLGVKEGESTEAVPTTSGLPAYKYLQTLVRSVWQSAWAVFPWPWSLPEPTFRKAP